MGPPIFIGGNVGQQGTNFCIPRLNGRRFSSAEIKGIKFTEYHRDTQPSGPIFIGGNLWITCFILNRICFNAADFHRRK